MHNELIRLPTCIRAIQIEISACFGGLSLREPLLKTNSFNFGCLIYIGTQKWKLVSDFLGLNHWPLKNFKCSTFVSQKWRYACPWKFEVCSLAVSKKDKFLSQTIDCLKRVVAYHTADSQASLGLRKPSLPTFVPQSAQIYNIWSDHISCYLSNGSPNLVSFTANRCIQDHSYIYIQKFTLAWPGKPYLLLNLEFNLCMHQILLFFAPLSMSIEAVSKLRNSQCSMPWSKIMVQ